jgi:nucleoside-diphosphate-sugar epimerase
MGYKNHAEEFQQLVEERMQKGNNKVLVTGAAGYLASSVIDELLQKGFKVLGVDNNFKQTCDTLIPFISHENFSFRLGDITDEEFVKGLYDDVGYVVHAAAIVGAPACKRYKTLSSLVNVGGTENVIKYKPKYVKLVYCNTGSIYKGGLGICDENSVVDPQSHYAKTKLEAEKVVLADDNTISHRYATAAGLSRTNMRVNLLANDLTYQAVTNRTLTIFEADFMRTFIHCRDISSAIVFTIENFDIMKAKQRVYNVGDDAQNYTKRDLVNMIKEKTHCHVSFAETEKDPDQRDYGYDSSALYSFGWRPKFTMDQTINEIMKAVPILTPWDKYR